MRRPIDHGELNTPLAKRYGKGGINVALDRHNAAVAKRAAAHNRAIRKAHADLFAQAREIIVGMSQARLTELGARHGITANAARKALLDGARVAPELALRAMATEARR